MWWGNAKREYCTKHDEKLTGRKSREDLAMIVSHSVAEVTEAPMAGPLIAAMHESVTLL